MKEEILKLIDEDIQQLHNQLSEIFKKDGFKITDGALIINAKMSVLTNIKKKIKELN